MMRKLLIVFLCGFVQRIHCSRVKFDPSFHEPLYRHDLHNEPVFKREHFYPREALAKMLPPGTLMRSEPMFGNEPMMAPPLPQPAVMPNDEFLPNNQIMQGDAFLRAEPILRREPFIRREPLLRRDAYIRGEPILSAGRIFQNAPIFREGGIFRNDPNTYTFVVPQCSCQERQDVGPSCPQESYFQIPQQIQPMQQPMQQTPMPMPPPTMPVPQAPIPMQQPILTHGIFFQKPMLKPQMFQPIVAYPRIQRLVRKNCKPLPDNIPFTATAVSVPPEFNSLNNEQVAFSGNFQNQGQQTQQETTSESSQSNPVTVRNVSNALALAQMSSIC